MLQLENRTPFAAERTIVMDKHGEKSWVVAVRATYRVLPSGACELAEEQPPALHAAAFHGAPGTSSVRYEADLVPTKRATDVLLNASAYAPGGRPCSRVDVGLRVGPVDKHLTVFGNRLWSRSATGFMGSSSPERFERMPITFERAFGGYDQVDPDPSKHRLFRPNPVGSGFATASAHLEGRLLPNVELPSQLISSWSDRPPPAGFGAVASYWSPRFEYAGTYDAEWQAQKFPLLPDDFDERFHQAALPDQQAGQLQGGETVVLKNLTESGAMQFSLPRVYLSLVTRFGKKKMEHRACLQSVVIEPDLAQVVLVWQSSLACHHLLDQLDVTVIREKTYL